MNDLPSRRRDWWLLALRGIAAILFGLAAFIWPGLTLELLILLFAAYALVDGAVSLIAYFRARRRETSLLLEGIVGLAAGVLAAALPGLAALSLVAIIAAWAILTGIAEIALTFRIRERLTVELLWILAGIVSIVFGIALVLFPVAGALAIVWLIGTYAVFFGVLLLILGLSLRQTGWSTT
jgi:uncharacterized membrane protein HdeD (DUF308 family)